MRFPNDPTIEKYAAEDAEYAREYEDYVDGIKTTVIPFPPELDRTFLNVVRFMYGLETESRKI